MRKERKRPELEAWTGHNQTDSVAGYIPRIPSWKHDEEEAQRALSARAGSPVGLASRAMAVDGSTRLRPLEKFEKVQ